MMKPGGRESLGVDTRNCPNTYYITLNAGSHRCTIIPRRLGWHRVEFVRDGTELEVDQVMYATGRVPNVRDLGLREIGLDVRADGRIECDTAKHTGYMVYAGFMIALCEFCVIVVQY